MLKERSSERELYEIKKKGTLQKLIIFYVYFNVLSIYFALSKTTL